MKYPQEVWKTRKFDDILLQHCNAIYNQNPIDRYASNYSNLGVATSLGERI